MEHQKRLELYLRDSIHSDALGLIRGIEQAAPKKIVQINETVEDGEPSTVKNNDNDNAIYNVIFGCRSI